MHSILLLFIKNPRPGYVKTRLARTVGDAEALRIYHILLEKTRFAARNANAQAWLFYSDQITENDDWPQSVFEKKIQSPGDLGERMEAAFQQAFHAGAQKVVIIGSDCPELSGDIINQAFTKLDEADFVIGPTPDGGYYLLGMRQFEPAVFRNVAWSTEAVFSETVRIIENNGGLIALLPELSDIDTEVDWKAYLARDS